MGQEVAVRRPRILHITQPCTSYSGTTAWHCICCIVLQEPFYDQLNVGLNQVKVNLLEYDMSISNEGGITGGLGSFHKFLHLSVEDGHFPGDIVQR